MDESKRWDEQGKLTHEGMKAAIEEGGSVMHRGRIISRAEDLPSKAEVVKASGDASARDAVSAELQAQIAKLQAQLAQVQIAPGMGGDLAPQHAEGEQAGILPDGNGKTAPATDSTGGAPVNPEPSSPAPNELAPETPTGEELVSDKGDGDKRGKRS